MNRRRVVVTLASACLLPALAGCRGGAPAVRAGDLVPLTADAVTLVLIGPPPERRATVTTGDPPLMKAGVYETALITADAEAFARESRGAFSAREMAGIRKAVVEKVDEALRREGFRAKEVPFPYPGNPEPKTLLCVLTPATEDAGSPSDRASGRGRKMVLVVLTVTDPTTGTTLAERRYYSGADARQGNR
jgi:hypothetical protein